MTPYEIVRNNAEYTTHFRYCRRTKRPFLTYQSSRGSATATVDVSTAGRTFTDFEEPKLSRLFSTYCRSGYMSSPGTFHCRIQRRRGEELLGKAAAVIAGDDRGDVSEGRR